MSQGFRYKALIVDDEEHACENINSIVNDYYSTKIEVIGYAYNTAEAEAKIELLNPDLVFLDIEMPGENSFEFLERQQRIAFKIIFVTAYDQYAVKAFRLNAIDYLLKPIDLEEFRKAIDKLEYNHNFEQYMRSNASFRQMLGKSGSNDTIILKDNVEYYIVRFDDLYFLEANRSYTKFYFNHENNLRQIILSYPISEYQDILPGDRFYRIHKSYIVNVYKIDKLVKEDSLEVQIKGLYNLPVGTRREKDFKLFLLQHKISL